MRLEDKYRQLIRIGVASVLFAAMMMVVNGYIGGDDPVKEAWHQHPGLRIAFPLLLIVVCWIWNILLLMFIQPLLASRLQSRWLTLYIPSYLGMYLVTMAIAYSPLVPPTIPGRIAHSFMVVVPVNTFAVLLIELVLHRHEAARIRLENAELRAVNLEAQHEKLIHQLQPHFLFNSLNALKTLIKRDKGQAEAYLMKLSEFLRFSLTHTQQSFVTLEEELRFSLHYLEMQKTRFPDSLFYSVDIPAGIAGRALLPAFSLQLLLENAIKHNALTLQAPLQVRIRYEDDKRLVVENNRRPRALAEPGTGLGLKNLSERYRLLVREDIRVTEETLLFQVSLGLIFSHEDHHH